jgi:hypothetical protein
VPPKKTQGEFRQVSAETAPASLVAVRDVQPSVAAQAAAAKDMLRCSHSSSTVPSIAGACLPLLIEAPQEAPSGALALATESKEALASFDRSLFRRVPTPDELSERCLLAILTHLARMAGGRALCVTKLDITMSTDASLASLSLRGEGAFDTHVDRIHQGPCLPLAERSNHR